MLKTGLSIGAIVVTAAAVASPITSERTLSGDEIVSVTAGKTFHYELLGHSRGDEQHFEDGRVVWRLPDGECLYGVWTVQEETLCYIYGDDRYGCWNVVAADDRIAHVPLNEEGERSPGPVVFIDRISEEDVGCAALNLASL